MRYADAHADTFYRVATEGLDPLARDGGLHVNLPRMREAGQTLQVCSVFTPRHYSGTAAAGFAARILDAIDRHLTADAGAFAPVRNRRDLAALGDRVGLIPWLEGASPLCGELWRLDALFARGVRGIGLTHNHANEVADGCGVPEPRRGLSAFGRELVARMNELGVAVDCAHLPRPAFDDVMAATKAPPCISHTGCRALVNITRNADDAMLRAVADRGGVVGIDFYPGHLRAGAGEPGGPTVTCDDIAAHIAHALHVCGREHVVIGGDLDGFADTCSDLRHLGDLDNLERALARRGLDDDTIRAVFSANLLRYLGDVLPA
ncbi:MAG: membrane dipeptidase [Planctomycetes bacterium]|jgi:membrane dipeptidase|nr:membrane dipeptidase [Planctomycetota bacterium]MCL4732031.1 membrane dipeptidase [Planctomycetota bacterium]